MENIKLWENNTPYFDPSYGQIETEMTPYIVPETLDENGNVIMIPSFDENDEPIMIEKVDEEWAKFILQNRNRKGKKHTYDICRGRRGCFPKY